MIRSLKIARSVSTPVVLVTTTDQSSTIAAVADSFPKVPLATWDCIRGFSSLNGPGKAAVESIMPKGEAFPGQVPGVNPVEALTMAMDLPQGTILMVWNAHKLWTEAPVIQAFSLIRDAYQTNQRMLLLLAPAAMLPLEVVQDVIVIDDPLPDEKRLSELLDEQIALARQSQPKLPDPTPMERANIIAGTTGLTVYAAESTFALAIAETGKVDPKVVWRRKRDIIGQVKGLKWDSWSGTLDQLGGLTASKEFADELFDGVKPPRCIVRVDEIEKSLAGFAGDNTGVSQDLVGTLLREMEENGWDGFVAVGPPGSGKTALSRSMGVSYGVPTIELDLGGLKESLVGASEANMRAAMKVIKAIGGANVLWVATCNKLDVLPPELRRRYSYGVWYFDLPSDEERKAIWDINLKIFGLPADVERPDDANWTGAEIRNACKMAAGAKNPERRTPAYAAKYIVPVHKANPQSIQKLRESADGKFLSASYPGVYQINAGAGEVQAPKRRAYAKSVES